MGLATDEELGHGRNSTPVTPDDSAELPRMRELYVGSGGDIVGRLREDTADRTWKNIPDCTRLPYDFKLIKTATSADDLLAIG